MSAVEVDQTLSYARRGHGVYHVVLHTAPLETAEGAQLVFRSRAHRVATDVHATESALGLELVAEVPVDELGDGRWQLELVRGGAEPLTLDARLVIGRHQPVALLTGPEPVSSIRPTRRPARPSGPLPRAKAKMRRAGAYVRGSLARRRG